MVLEKSEMLLNMNWVSSFQIFQRVKKLLMILPESSVMLTVNFKKPRSMVKSQRKLPVLNNKSEEEPKNSVLLKSRGKEELISSEGKPQSQKRSKDNWNLTLEWLLKLLLIQTLEETSNMVLKVSNSKSKELVATSLKDSQLESKLPKCLVNLLVKYRQKLQEKFQDLSEIMQVPEKDSSPLPKT